MALEPGLVNEENFIVEEHDTARFSGGEAFPLVLSTPRMISFMERTAAAAVGPYLQEGQGTVGTVVNIRHLGASPVGMEVRVRAELLEVDRRRLRYKVEAWDTVEKIGEGEHERFIIDQSRFDARLAEKQALVKK